LISSALTLAVRRDYIEHNPAIKAVAPTPSIPRKKLPLAAEVVRLIRAGEKFGHSMGPAIALAALTGARAGEVAALQWQDIDLRRGRVRIDKAATEVEGRIIVKSTKTDDEHTARVEGPNLVILRRTLGKPGPKGSYVVDGGIKPINPGIISDRFTKVRTLARVRTVTFHSLRGYWATALLDAGVPVHAVAKAGGWRTERMVLERYGQATKSGADQAAAVELLPGA
jgi:integrase